MRPYEAILIFNPAVPEDRIDAAVAKLEKKIKDAGGADIVSAKWGMKKFAAPIKKITEGYYVLINFSGEGKVPNELRSLLRVSEEIIRYTVMVAKPAQPEPKEEKVEIEPSMIAPQEPSAGSQGEISA